MKLPKTELLVAVYARPDYQEWSQEGQGGRCWGLAAGPAIALCHRKARERSLSRGLGDTGIFTPHHLALLPLVCLPGDRCHSFAPHWVATITKWGNMGNTVENLESRFYLFPKDYLIQSRSVFQLAQISFFWVWAFPQVLRHIFCLSKPETFYFPQSIKMPLYFQLSTWRGSECSRKSQNRDGASIPPLPTCEILWKLLNLWALIFLFITWR